MIYRYDDYMKVHTNLNPLDDLASQLLFFNSEDYTVDTLNKNHSIGKKQAKSRHKKISPHANAAYQYIEAFLASPKEVSFLPLYYAILNITKLYILAKNDFSKLSINRQHGASYQAHGKASHSLLTDRIILRSNGVIPLFYSTITGNSLPNLYSIEMRDVYPFLWDIQYEWRIATNDDPKMAAVNLTPNYIERKGVRLIRLESHHFSLAYEHFTARSLHLYENMNKDRQHDHRYTSRYEGLKGRTEFDYFDSKINRFMIYNDILEDSVLTPVSAKDVMMFEEMPILLSIFHLGSVCRYKPDFFARLLDSKFGPVVISARTNLILRYLILFWSFMNQSHLIVRRR